jgi:hypothetical protein
MKKYSIPLALGSWSDFLQNNPRFTISECCSQLDQGWHRRQSFHLEIFLENSRVATAMVFYQHDGMSIIQPWGLISWDGVNLPTWKHNFPFLFNNHAFVHAYYPHPQIALHEWALDQCLHQVTFMVKSFPSEVRIRNFSATSRDCTFDGIVLSAIPKSYLDASHMKPMLFITLNECFRCGSSV